MILPQIEVAATILRRPDGQILLAQRRLNQLAGGYWEVPGGKIEPGETPEQAARRELAEEVGVNAGPLKTGPVHEHRFPTRIVRIHFFIADEWDGEPSAREGQTVAWSDPSDPVEPILPSNARILAAMSLPSLFAVVSADRKSALADILDKCGEAMSSGARFFQFRAPHLSPDQRVNLARHVSKCARSGGAKVLLVGTAIEAHRAGADGVHSTADQLRQLGERPQTPLWSASCHGEADAEKAVSLGADFVVMSPVLQSTSHPDMGSLGWRGLRAVTDNSPVPVYAQGGMSPETLADAHSAGAIGIAMSVAPTVSIRRGTA